MAYCPNRGDIIRITLDPALGHEQSKRRPAYVISPLAYNQRVGLTLLCPITQRTKGYPWEVPLPKGLPTFGVILSDQVKSMDWEARNAELICSTFDNHAEVFEEVVGRIQPLLS